MRRTHAMRVQQQGGLPHRLHAMQMQQQGRLLPMSQCLHAMRMQQKGCSGLPLPRGDNATCTIQAATTALPLPCTPPGCIPDGSQAHTRNFFACSTASSRARAPIRLRHTHPWPRTPVAGILHWYGTNTQPCMHSMQTCAHTAIVLGTTAAHSALMLATGAAPPQPAPQPQPPAWACLGYRLPPTHPPPPPVTVGSFSRQSRPFLPPAPPLNATGQLLYLPPTAATDCLAPLPAPAAFAVAAWKAPLAFSATAAGTAVTLLKASVAVAAVLWVGGREGKDDRPGSNVGGRGRRQAGVRSRGRNISLQAHDDCACCTMKHVGQDGASPGEGRMQEDGTVDNRCRGHGTDQWQYCISFDANGVTYFS